MTGPGRRKAAVTLTAAQAAGLSALLTTLDEFLRSSPGVAAELTDELPFTALGYRCRLAGSGHAEPDQETR